MPRGKRNVYTMLCTNPKKDSFRSKDNRLTDGDSACNKRVGTVRLHNQKDGKSWRDFKVQKFCSNCRMRTTMRLKQERHQSS